MAATKYQILYRYTNPNSNQFIKNDIDTDYESVFEFYHDKHQIIVGTSEEKLNATKDKSDLIINGNNTANNNYNMLFKFTGTKRINKKIWIPESIGYVIRDKNAIKNLITRAVDNDYSGDYLLIEGNTIENGVVVSKINPVTKSISISQDDAENKKYFIDEKELMNTIVNKTIAQLNSYNVEDYGSLSKYTPYTESGRAPATGGVQNISIKIGSDFALSNITYKSSSYQYNTAKDALTDTSYANIIANGGLAFTSVTINPNHVQTYNIPAHYEEVAEYPYIIADTYEKIEQSPWFVLSTHSSLNSALEKVKPVVKALGLENVKLIKVVPTDQCVKIN